MEQQIKLAAKLYRCRDTARQIYGDGYVQALQSFIRRIQDRMSTKGCNELLAVLDIAESIKGMENEGTATTLFMAAAVEMLEPSTKRPSPGKEGKV
jgi:hypothetical protein